MKPGSQPRWLDDFVARAHEHWPNLSLGTLRQFAQRIKDSELRQLSGRLAAERWIDRRMGKA